MPLSLEKKTHTKRLFFNLNFNGLLSFISKWALFYYTLFYVVVIKYYAAGQHNILTLLI